jgi:hypothetical protein
MIVTRHPHDAFIVVQLLKKTIYCYYYYIHIIWKAHTQVGYHKPMLSSSLEATGSSTTTKQEPWPARRQMD